MTDGAKSLTTTQSSQRSERVMGGNERVKGPTETKREAEGANLACWVIIGVDRIVKGVWRLVAYGKETEKKRRE